MFHTTAKQMCGTAGYKWHSLFYVWKPSGCDILQRNNWLIHLLNEVYDLFPSSCVFKMSPSTFIGLCPSVKESKEWQWRWFLGKWKRKKETERNTLIHSPVVKLARWGVASACMDRLYIMLLHVFSPTTTAQHRNWNSTCPCLSLPLAVRALVLFPHMLTCEHKELPLLPF